MRDPEVPESELLKKQASFLLHVALGARHTSNQLGIKCDYGHTCEFGIPTPGVSLIFSMVTDHDFPLGRHEMKVDLHFWFSEQNLDQPPDRMAQFGIKAARIADTAFRNCLTSLTCN